LVPEQYVGVAFRQLTLELRWVKDGTSGPDFVSARPYDQRGDRFLDSEEPTLVSFAADDNVDVEFLLKVGAIAEDMDGGGQAPALPDGEASSAAPESDASLASPTGPLGTPQTPGAAAPSPPPSPRGRGGL